MPRLFFRGWGKNRLFQLSTLLQTSRQLNAANFSRLLVNQLRPGPS